MIHGHELWEQNLIESWDLDECDILSPDCLTPLMAELCVQSAWQHCIVADNFEYFRPKLKEQMEYCMAHPDELTKVAAVQKRVLFLSNELTKPLS